MTRLVNFDDIKSNESEDSNQISLENSASSDDLEEKWQMSEDVALWQRKVKEQETKIYELNSADSHKKQSAKIEAEYQEFDRLAKQKQKL